MGNKITNQTEHQFRPWITGIRLLNALGDSMEQVWESLVHGITGIHTVRSFDTSCFDNNNGGEVQLPILSMEGEQRMAELTHHAMKQCLQNAGLSAQDFSAGRSAVVFGSSLGAIFHINDHPVSLDGFLPSVLENLELQSPLLSVSTACSSASDALVIADGLIRHHDLQWILCGGTDILDTYKYAGHTVLSTLSPTICTPFGESSDGTTLGEGTCFFLMESPDTARERDVRALAVLAGTGNSTDSNKITTPDETGAGAILAIERALSDAGIGVEQLAYVNAHGSGTPINDTMEARVFSQLFHTHKPAISSTKGAFGHLLGATGAIEAAVTIYSLIQGMAPPTTNTTKPHPSVSNQNLIHGFHPQALQSKEYALSVTYGFGGANVGLVFKKSGTPA